ncbi:LysR family transcriptional regulator [Nocardioides sp. JQ2195]|uniref:LysR substrate-binding domain-containing protein n=1 Tax=Nocardioides sp. JQ2195 TaxID=2592334 RepID=UPI00143EA9CE|nr:LysR substrate-binding domain-containing protein [Nocardioides sp. JQ2195]QIX28423.1 LysR family transcriptional regulator [Nocardioides sp. JQ2195]
MDLRHLRYFVAVAEELNFSRAAARLHMAQPPLSQTIKQLEHELGFALLRRTTRRVELTAAGVAFLEDAQEILAAVDTAGDRAARVAAGRLGRLVVGCVGSTTYSLLPQLARRMRSELPDVEFAFRGEMLSPDQVDALREGSLDLGVMRRPADTAGLSLTSIRQERMWAAVPHDHPLAARDELRLEDLHDEELIVHAGAGRSVMSGLVHDMFREAGLTAVVAHEVAETSTLVTFVAGGLGIAVVPEPTAALAVPGVVYLPLADVPDSELVAATRAGDESPVLVRALGVLTELAAPISE